MDKVFLSILNMSFTASFIIAAIMLARLPLKKAPKLISYALWAVAGFRLIFPFTLESVFSLLPFNTAPIPQDIAMQAVPRINSGIVAIDNMVSGLLPAAVPAAVSDIGFNPMVLLTVIGTYLWLIGVAIMLIYSVVSIVLLKRRLRYATCIAGNLYEADNLKTPFVIGLFRPRIYIPSELSDEERSYIVLHERTHIRRGDHIVKLFAYFVLCLHWFNPFAWAAFVLMGADMEMSCDERVMRELGVEIKNAYSLSLVRVAAGHKILNGSPLAFGEGGMKERVKNVLNFKKHSRVIIIAAVVLVAMLSVGFAVNRMQKSMTAEAAMEQLVDSIEFNYGKIRFQIPLDYRDTQNWNIHISGRAEFEDGMSMSVHYLEDEVWKADEWYTIITEDAHLTELLMDIYLTDENGEIIERSIDLLEAAMDAHWELLALAREAELALDVVIDDLGDYEMIANAWQLAQIQAFMDMSDDNMAHLEDGAIDWLEVHWVAKEGLPKAIIFSAEISVKPTYPMKRNSFWMPGNTVPDPVRGDEWGQMYHEIELRMADDGKYHLASIGTGGMGGEPWDGYERYEGIVPFASLAPKDQLTSYLTVLFTDAYAPYYDELSCEISDYSKTIDSGDFTAYFLWSMRYVSTSYYDAPSDIGKEQTVNFGLMVTAKIDTDGRLTNIAAFNDSSAVGEPDHFSVEDFFPPKPSDGTVLYTAKLTHDGSEQTIVLQDTYMPNFYTLQVRSSDGMVLCTLDAGSSHMGWNTVLLTHIEGKDYLMQYSPTMYQGNCFYSFSVFSFDGNGEAVALDSDSIEFSINSPAASYSFRRSDAEPIKAFYEHLNKHLAQSELLITSDANYISHLLSGADGGYELYSTPYIIGSQDVPYVVGKDYFYGSDELSLDEQLELFISDFIHDYGEIAD